MTKKVTPYNIHLSIRPRAKESVKAFEMLNSILDAYPAANGTLAGVGHDSRRVIFCMRFSVPVSNTDPGAIASIKCINAIFEKMFEYMPCYSAEPTEAEARAAESFLSTRDKTLDMQLDLAMAPLTVATS